MKPIVFVIFLSLFLVMLFMLISKKFKNDLMMHSSFECGFSSYFYSRFSFSIHYFMVGLIFLFLDLELCFLMPFMADEFPSMILAILMLALITILLIGLILEWANNKIDWVF